MGTNQDPIQGAVVFMIAVVGALLNGTFDALVCVAAHACILLFYDYSFSMAFDGGINRGKVFLFIAFFISP